MVLLHVEHSFVCFVQHVLRFMVLEIIVVTKEILFVVQFGLTNAFEVV